MSIKQVDTHYPPMGRLWTIDDLAAFAVGQDASALVKMSGFPQGMKLAGIRGLRWYPPHVVRFFEARSNGDVAAGLIDPDEVATAAVPVLPKMDLADFKVVA